MTDRKKLTLGKTDSATSAQPGRSWSISPARLEKLKERARIQRRNPSEAQTVLWDRLKDKQCGFTFTREVIMGSAIVDFACRSRWLVVETGAGSEAEATLAALSDRKLTDVGVRVLRFSDEQVLGDTDAVVDAIFEQLNQPWEKPQPGRSPAFADAEDTFSESETDA